jgi:hypothetical protein
MYLCTHHTVQHELRLSIPIRKISSRISSKKQARSVAIHEKLRQQLRDHVKKSPRLARPIPPDTLCDNENPRRN